MTAPLCQEMLQFSDKATEHDTPTTDGEVVFARSCDLVAEGLCVPCGYAVCTHHRWARHDGHEIVEQAS